MMINLVNKSGKLIKNEIGETNREEEDGIQKKTEWRKLNNTDHIYNLPGVIVIWDVDAGVFWFHNSIWDESSIVLVHKLEA